MTTSNEQIRKQLIAKANKANENFKQYEGHFDNYKLAVANKDIKNKYREVIFPKGSYMIVDTKSIHQPEMGPYVNTKFIYAVAGEMQIDTSIRLKEITIQE